VVVRSIATGDGHTEYTPIARLHPTTPAPTTITSGLAIVDLALFRNDEIPLGFRRDVGRVSRVLWQGIDRYKNRSASILHFGNPRSG
jgi:hypothetical protein